MRRRFRHVRMNDHLLRSGGEFDFALTHAVALYNLKSVYSLINKNACSTLRFSAAVSNGFVSPDDNPKLLRSLLRVFRPSLEFAATAQYAFVVLRCPYRRLGSAFLDKIVDVRTRQKYTLPATRFERIWRKKVKVPYLKSTYYDDMSFSDFCHLIQKQKAKRLDQHWRPQSAFLLYHEYDDYFCLEDFSSAMRQLDSRGLPVYDTRRGLKHDTSHLEEREGDFSRISVTRIRQMKANGEVPSYSSLFDADCRKIVEQVYSEDIATYNRHFPKDWKLFD